MIVNQLISIGVSFPQRGLVRNSKKKEITVGMCQKNYIWRNRLVPAFSVALGSELIISFLRNLVFNFAQLIQLWLNITWRNNIRILKACVLRMLSLYERFWNGNGVLKVKLWLNIEFCNSDYLLKLDFWPRIYMSDAYVSNNCPALCFRSGLWLYVWGWGEILWKQFSRFVFPLLILLLFHTKTCPGGEWNKGCHSVHKRPVLSTTQKNSIPVPERQSDKKIKPCQLLYGHALCSGTLQEGIKTRQKEKDYKQPGIKNKF